MIENNTLEVAGDPPEDEEEDSREEDLSSVIESQLTPPERKSPVYIDDLQDAVKDGVFLAQSGECIVVEKWYGQKYLGTGLYKVKNVDPDTGDISLHDEENYQSSMTNWKTAPQHGWKIKLAPRSFSRNERSKQDYAVQQNKRATVAVIGDTQEVAGVKKRGRPPGSKNRPKDVIAKELSEKMAIRRAKREARLKKRFM